MPLSDDLTFKQLLKKWVVISPYEFLPQPKHNSKQLRCNCSVFSLVSYTSSKTIKQFWRNSIQIFRPLFSILILNVCPNQRRTCLLSALWKKDLGGDSAGNTILCQVKVLTLHHAWEHHQPLGRQSLCISINANTALSASKHSEGEGNGTPLQYCCPENSIDGGAWWAAVHGVTKSRTQLSDCTHRPTTI